MNDRSIDKQLDHYLTDVHSIEEQALTQLRTAPDIAGDEQLSQVFNQHLRETEGHESRVRERLERRGKETSTVKDIAGKVGGFGMVAFARANPDTPGKLTAHAYSYEHLEIAAYEMLRRVAEAAGDEDTIRAANANLEQEREMSLRLEGCFDSAVVASLEQLAPDSLEEQLVKYLVDAHSIEQQAEQLLGKGPDLVEDEQLAAAFQEHLDETKEHSRRVTKELTAHGAKPSRFQDAAMRAGALNIGAFFDVQPDTTAKLAGFAFAFEHLEIAAYEMLRRVGERAGDDGCVELADSILPEERVAAQKLAGLWDHVVATGLAEVGAAR